MLSILHIIIALLLSFSIMLQQRASGLSATFGGTGTSYVQRRGAESVLFKATTWLSVAFFVLGVVRIYV
jgi:protein translocase SecG subunit